MVLPFTARVFYSFLEQYNSALWPAQVAVIILILIMGFLTVKPFRFGDRLIGLVLASGWAWCGLYFYWSEFASINFVATAYAPFFALQAILLVISVSALGKVRFRLKKDIYSRLGFGLILLGLAGFPVADAVFGQGVASVRLPVFAPGPTVLVTLGFLMTSERRTPYHVLILPVLWCLITIATAWSLGMWQDVVFALAGVGAGILAAFKNRGQGRHPR